MLYSVKGERIYINADKQVVEDIVDYLGYVLNTIDISNLKNYGYILVEKKDVAFVQHILIGFSNNCDRQQTIALYNLQRSFANYTKEVSVKYRNDIVLWARRYYLAAGKVSEEQVKRLGDYSDMIIDYLQDGNYDAFIMIFKSKIKLAA